MKYKSRGSQNYGSDAKNQIEKRNEKKNQTEFKKL